MTSDMKYGYEMTESGGVKFHAVKTEMPGRDLLTAEPDELVDYVILTTETKISITPMATLPVLDVNGHYAVVMPCRHDTYFPFPEYGVILFNPKSGQNLWLPCSDQFCGIMHRQIYAFAQDRFRELFEGGDTMATVSTQGKIVLQSERQVMIFDQTGTDPFYIGTWSISGLSVPKGRIQEYMGKYYVMYNRSFEDFVKYGKVLDQWSLY